MPHLVAAMVAYPTFLNVGTLTPANADQLYSGIRQGFLSSAWAQTSSGVVTAGMGLDNFLGRPFTTLLSAQSPWWDHSVTPPAFYEARVKLRLVNFNQQGVFTGVFFQAMTPDETIKANQSFLPFLTFLPGSTYPFIIGECQGLIYRDNFAQDVLICNPHTPAFEQEDGLVNRFFISHNWAQIGELFNGNPNNFMYSKNAGGEFFRHGAAGVGSPWNVLQLALHQGPIISGGLFRNVGIWNRFSDPLMALPDTWHTLKEPATICWPDQDLPGAITERGFLWGGLTKTKMFPGGKTINYEGRQFIRVLGAPGTSTSAPGSLFIARS